MLTGIERIAPHINPLPTNYRSIILFYSQSQLARFRISFFDPFAEWLASSPFKQLLSTVGMHVGYTMPIILFSTKFYFWLSSSYKPQPLAIIVELNWHFTVPQILWNFCSMWKISDKRERAPLCLILFWCQPFRLAGIPQNPLTDENRHDVCIIYAVL